MKSSSLAKLAVDLSAGVITADAISEEFGDGVLADVLGLVGGGIAATAVHSLMDVSGLSSAIDDIFGEW